MRKIRLNIEELAVESFNTSEAGMGRGTVEGRDSFASCGGTCEPQCPPPPKPATWGTDCYTCPTNYGICTC